MLEYNFKSYSIKDENVIHMVTLTDCGFGLLRYWRCSVIKMFWKFLQSCNKGIYGWVSL